MSKPPKVVAIVVTYNPHLDDLVAVLESTSPQVDELVVVDNTPAPNPKLLDCASGLNNLHLVTLGDNLGIAYAHNVGIEWADDRGADYVLLLDQDSKPLPGMVELLLLDIESENIQKLKVAAVGPAFDDPRTGFRSYFMVSRFGFPLRYKPEKKYDPKKLISVSFLISSGTLIPMRALLELGGKRSNYFIDHVDTEWCLRARAGGYRIIGEHRALMWHSLGDEVKRIWFFYMRSVAYHSPLRDYYMFRNTLLMLNDVQVSIIWRLFLLSRLVQFALYFLTIVKGRRRRLRLMLLGLYHGLRQISGRLDPETGICTAIPRTKFDPK